MANGYYYLISALPELSLNDKNLAYNMVSYRDFVQQELSKADAKLLKVLYYKFDIINLVNLIKENNKPWLAAGNYTKADLSDMLLMPDSMPVFMQRFTEETSKKWNVYTAKELLNKATSHYIDWVHTINNSFLRKWLRFDVNLKNLLIWLNSHKFGLDPTAEVLGNHYEAEYLRQTSKEDIDLKSWDFRYREVMTHFDNPNIAIREYLIDEMRWHYLSELEESHDFGIERLLGFIIRLQIIHRNIQNTEQQGRQRLAKLLENIREGYEMPKEFDVADQTASHQTVQELVHTDEPESE